MSHEQNEQRIRDVVTNTLRLSMTDSSMPLRMGSTPGWDSLGHMSVVIALEKEFGIVFPSFRLPELVDVAAIAAAVTDLQPK
jgi:acyl carrier protein